MTRQDLELRMGREKEREGSDPEREKRAIQQRESAQGFIAMDRQPVDGAWK
jgi:hypothetical protein